MKLRPLGYHVIIEIEEPEAAKSDIYIPPEFLQDEVTNADQGVVRAIGPTCFSGMEMLDGETGEERAAQWGFKIGDTVAFKKYQGTTFSVEGYENHIMVLDQDVKGVIDE